MTARGDSPERGSTRPRPHNYSGRARLATGKDQGSEIGGRGARERCLCWFLTSSRCRAAPADSGVKRRFGGLAASSRVSVIRSPPRHPSQQPFSDSYRKVACAGIKASFCSKETGAVRSSRWCCRHSELTPAERAASIRLGSVMTPGVDDDYAWRSPRMLPSGSRSHAPRAGPICAMWPVVVSGPSP